MNWRLSWTLLILCVAALYLCSRPPDIATPPDGTVAAARTDAQNTFLEKAPEWTVALATILTLFGILYQADEMKKATVAMQQNTEEARKQTLHIGRQAQSMRYQTTHLKNSAIQARKTAIAARISAKAARDSVSVVVAKERAWLNVQPKALALTPMFNIAYAAEIIVTIDGPTRADVMDSKIAAYLSTVETLGKTDMQPLMYGMASLPTVILPNTVIPEQAAIYHSASTPNLDAALIADIQSGKLLVEIQGFINYKDAFGIERKTRFRQAYGRHALYSSALGWKECGAPDDNRQT